MTKEEKEKHERHMRRAIRNATYNIIQECYDDPKLLDSMYLALHNLILKVKRDKALKELKKEHKGFDVKKDEK